MALLPRLAADAVELVLASRCTDGPFEAVAHLGVPLAAEAGLRAGVRGAVVPAVNALTTGLDRRRRGRPANAGSVQFQVAAVASGMAVAWYERRSVALTMARRDDERAAREHEARLAGQNEVAMGADSVVDLLTRTTPMLGTSPDAALDDGWLSAWKAGLAASSASRARYLGTALRSWESRRNQQHDLSLDVEVHLAPGAGTVLVSAGQAAELARTLDRRALRGRVDVAVGDGAAARPPGAALSLTVNGAAVDVEADAASSVPAFDPVPMIFLLNPFWFMRQRSARVYGVPGPVAAGVSVCSLAMAAWAHREIGRRGASAHPGILAGSIALGAFNAVVSGATARRAETPEGLQVLPFIEGLNGIGVVAGLYGHELRPGQRRAAITATVGVVALGLAVGSRPIRWTEVASGVSWSVVGFLSCVGVNQALRDAAATLDHELGSVEDVAVRTALVRGRTDVAALVSRARDDAWRMFERSHASLTPRVQEEAARRLAEVDRRLEVLTCASA